MDVQIVVAIIGVVGLIIVEILRRLWRQNVKDHAIVIDRLDLINDKVDGVREDVAHLKGEHHWLRDRLFRHIDGADD